ncbi:MAG: hypothetical protein M5R40_19055 [Anaerolineae bacterium]|nr:hypothetical protein [Anaerolineae bacterium]
MISGRENYRRAIEFEGPAYLPSTVGVSLDWMWEKDEAKVARIRELRAQFPNDMLVWLDVARNLSEPETVNGVTHWVDEWGTGWADDGHGAKPDVHPLAGGYDLLEGMPSRTPRCRAGLRKPISAWKGAATATRSRWCGSRSSSASGCCAASRTCSWTPT